MTHEPECLPIRRYTMNGEPRCDCGIARAAYQRGVETAATETTFPLTMLNDFTREAHQKGYTQGYNEAMRLHKNLDVMDWVYGYNREERMTQHGQGENP